MVDSTADLPPELAAAWGITVVPCVIHFGRESFRDGLELSLAEFYRRLETESALPTTASPGPEVFAQVYRRLAAESEQIVSIHLSAKLSAVYNSARLGARDVTQTQVAVVDGGSVTMGLGWQAVMAARWARDGCSLEDIVRRLEQSRPRIRVLALLDTIEFLRRGGRVNRAVAMLSALLDVKPMISVEGGDVLPLGRVRSRKKALDRLVSLVEELGRLEELAVLHTRALSDAHALAARLAASFPRQRVVIAEVGPIIGTHVGPNGLGVACVTSESG